MEEGFLEIMNIFNELLTCLEDWRIGNYTIFVSQQEFFLDLCAIYLLCICTGQSASLPESSVHPDATEREVVTLQPRCLAWKHRRKHRIIPRITQREKNTITEYQADKKRRNSVISEFRTGTLPEGEDGEEDEDSYTDELTEVQTSDIRTCSLEDSIARYIVEQ